MSLSASQGQHFSTLQRYLSLPQNGRIQAEYIWIGGSGSDLRSKTRTLPKAVKCVSELPGWNYDGSSTDQASGDDSEVYLKPVKMVKDPFRRGDNVLVLCETLEAKSMNPLETNNRSNAQKVFEEKSVKEEEPWYGIEQEYTLFDSRGVTPLGWPSNGYPAPQVGSPSLSLL